MPSTSCPVQSDNTKNQRVRPESAMEDLENLIRHAVKDSRWQDVGELLKRNRLTTELSAFVLQEACKVAPQSERVQLIISVTGQCEHGPLLSHLMTQDLWYVIDDVLQYGQLNTDDQKYVVEEASQLADDLNFLTYILPHCYEDQIPTILTVLVTRDCWQSTGAVLQKSVCEDLTAWTVEEASKKAREEDFIHLFLPHCSGSMLSAVLEELSQRNLMGAVDAVLKKIIRVSKKESSLGDTGTCKEVHEHKGGSVVPFETDCLPGRSEVFADSASPNRPGQPHLSLSCMPSQLAADTSDCKTRQGKESVDCCRLSHANKTRDWDMLEFLLQADEVNEIVLYQQSSLCENQNTQPEYMNSKTQHKSKREKYQQNVKPQTTHFPAELTETLKLYTGVLIKVIEALESSSGIIDAFLKLAVAEELYDYSKCRLPNFPHLIADVLLQWNNQETVMELLMKMVGSMLQALAQDQRIDPLMYNLQEEIAALMPKGTTENFLVNLPMLEDVENLKTVVDQLMNRILLHNLGIQLNQNTVESIHEAFLLLLQSLRCHENDFVRSVMKQITTPSFLYSFGERLKDVTSNDKLLANRASEIPDHRGNLQSSDKEIMKSEQHTCASASQRHMILGETQEKAPIFENSRKEEDECLTMLKNYTVDQLDSMLKTLVKNGNWRVAAIVINQGVSEENRKWAVEEACKQAPPPFLLFILQAGDWRAYLDDQADEIVTHLAKRKMSLGNFIFKVSLPTRMRLIEECIQAATNAYLAELIPDRCKPDKTDTILEQLVQHGRWDFVGCMILRGASDQTTNWAVEMAAQHAEETVLTEQILCHCANDQLSVVLKHVDTRGLKRAAEIVLQCMVSKFLSSLVSNKNITGAECESTKLRTRLSLLSRLSKKTLPYAVKRLSESLKCDAQVAELLSVAFVDFVSTEQNCDFNVNTEFRSQLEDKFVDVLEIQDKIVMFVVKNSVPTEKENREKDVLRKEVSNWNQKLRLASLATQFKTPDQLQHFFHLSQRYFETERTHESDRVFVSVLATVPLIPVVQSVALRIMLRLGRWDIISLSSLSHVWENVRRELFQAAVKQRQWNIVKQWADNTLYDDQRGFALDESFKEQQWEVLMLLADHGLDKTELNRVHYRLVNYAGWDCVRELLERGGDATELIQLLRTGKKRRKATLEIQPPESKKERRLRLTRREERAWLRPFNKTVLQRRWHAVLYQLRNRPSEEDVLKMLASARKDSTQEEIFDKIIHRLSSVDRGTLIGQTDLSDVIRSQKRKDIAYAVEVAKKKEAWHVVIQLVRLGMDPDQRNSLFFEMVTRHQWGVCRVLLEHGVTTELKLAFLHELQNMRQWVLICRIMENNVEDSVIRKIIKHALERREGSVVWHGMRLLGKKLSIEERDTLFQKAMSLDIWQAVKPLVEEKDSSGEKHRDKALVEAIENCQWDVLEHCQIHYGDINIKKDSGETGLQTAAKKEDWEAVEELMWRGADQFESDSEGKTPLFRAACAQQWDTVKLLVQFHGELTRCDNFANTPIQMMIDHSKADIIDEALFWGQNFNKGVNRILETPLHAACAAGDYKTMYYLMARGMDPLCVTLNRQSVLMYAVMNKERPEKMVAECIKLGLSTHQPAITDTMVRTTPCPWYNLVHREWRSGIRSPFEYAVVHGLPRVARMLYESGSCSYHELHKLYGEFLGKLTNRGDGQYAEAFGAEYVQETKDQIFDNIVNFLDYVEGVARTPRSLRSTCRTAISRQIKMSQRRQRYVQSLPLLHRKQKEYVLFSDLTDPAYGS